MQTSVPHKYLIRTFLALFFLFHHSHVSAQECTSQITLNLKNVEGGVYPNQTVTFKSADGNEFTKKSNAKGEVIFDLPCDEKFEVSISNYTHEVEMFSPKSNGSWAVRTFTYMPNMAENDKYFNMNEGEKSTVDKALIRLPDTTFFKGAVMRRPVDIQNYSTLSITLKDLENGPLMNEEVTMTGLNRNKSFKGKTNSSGQIQFYLPKGDKYSLNFKYNKSFTHQEVRYSRGTATMRLDLMYIGSKEIERRMKEEEERIKREEERLKREHEEFLAWCKKEGLTEAEGHRKRLMESSGTKDTVVMAVLNRNRWYEKLIVCDLTGSMDPYANQLAVWYQLHYKKEKNLQFVFFNDGDSKSDASKVIGSTGGIYYQPGKGMDSLIILMSKVRSRGNGGDCPENNMEALIKGVRMANPYKELVMIVDNNAPVKDIELLKDFNRPVHIILCGAYKHILTDYLQIAWKTKGTIHTIEEDITKIAAMSEGETVKVSGVTYKIMGGEFVRISDG